ncbi:hypothetical protein DL96DRAFT_1459763 [Flagelloscypha sp. PMI_526]|nr:hypothetical protein DL96DRAFT_1459763 [Flagelloscypha sp. PMI_526]
MEFWQDHDQETHVGEGVEEGQYLHVAEALRYEIERKAENRRAEWILLSEDDFPLCEYGGRQGWDVVKEVVRVLERDRTKHGDVRSGFVGTGGSGFIIHRTYLPLLIHILRTYASNSTTLRLPDQVVRRPPDVAIQDCLLGKQASLCERRQGASNKPPLVIPSRLVVDHIGGMYTTNRDKAFNADKWRCGWRHPFHGREEVGVVVV